MAHVEPLRKGCSNCKMEREILEGNGNFLVSWLTCWPNMISNNLYYQ